MQWRRSAGRCALSALLVAASNFSAAQNPPKRLSQYLLENPPAAGAYLPGLSWRVPSEEAAQQLLQHELLAELESEPGLRSLQGWVRTLQVTGRVPLAASDPRWLATHRRRDPVLMPGQSIVVPG